LRAVEAGCMSSQLPITTPTIVKAHGG